MPDRRSIKSRQIFAIAAACLGAGAVGGGCSSTTPPDLEIVEVTVGDRSSEAMVLNFAMRGTNENGFPLPLGEVRYRLDLGGDRVFTGIRSAQMTIPRNGTGMIELPAAFELDEPGTQLAGRTSYRLVGSVHYRPDGTFPGVLYDSNFYRPARIFSISGMLDFDPLQEVGPLPEGEPQNPNLRVDDESL